MAILTIATMLLLQRATAAANFLCSSTLDEHGTALSGNVCRKATTVCETDAICDGASLDCPENKFQPAGTVIRASTSIDDCDPAEVCNGVNASVPPDVDNCVKVAIDVLGQSGKFSIFDESVVGRADPNMVTVEVDALRELDSNGVEVGTTGPVKHSIQTFANQIFTIYPAENATIGEVSATKLAFDTSISSIGKLIVNTYILKNSGTVGTDTETWAVRTNDVKFNIVLYDWNWCGETSNCEQGVPPTIQNGEYIDVDIKIKGQAATPERNGSSKDYALGGGVGLGLSDRVFTDGEWMTMPAGFPKMEFKGGSAIFTFRFPKFIQEARYDPVVEFAASLPAKPLITPSSTTTTPAPYGGSSRLLENGAETASKRRARGGEKSRHQTFLAASMLEIMQKPRKARKEKHTEF